jgi:uncharacterized repeat protein (TIGR02543 family)
MKKVLLLFLMIFGIFFVGLTEVYATGSSITTSTVFPDAVVRIYFVTSDVEDVLTSTNEISVVETNYDLIKLDKCSACGQYGSNIYELYIDGVLIYEDDADGDGRIWHSTYETDGYIDIDMSSWTLAKRTVSSVDETELTDMGITWEDMTVTYTVTYDSNGGSAVDSEEVEDNDYADEPDDPTKTGYTFDAWYTDDGTFVNEFDFLSDTITDDITLYANWDINTYTVTFDSKFGSSVSSQEVDYNDYADEPSDPVKQGGLFEGWYTDDGVYEELFDFETTAITDDITLYAYYGDSTAIEDFGSALTSWLSVVLALTVGAFSGVVAIFWSDSMGFTIYGNLMLFALVVGFVGLAISFIVSLIKK